MVVVPLPSLNPYISQTDPDYLAFRVIRYEISLYNDAYSCLLSFTNSSVLRLDRTTKKPLTIFRHFTYVTKIEIHSSGCLSVISRKNWPAPYLLHAWKMRSWHRHTRGRTLLLHGGVPSWPDAYQDTFETLHRKVHKIPLEGNRFRLYR